MVLSSSSVESLADEQVAVRRVPRAGAVRDRRRPGAVGHEPDAGRDPQAPRLADARWRAGALQLLVFTPLGLRRRRQQELDRRRPGHHAAVRGGQARARPVDRRRAGAQAARCSATGSTPSSRWCRSRALMVGLVLLGNDLGTAMVLMLLVGGGMFLAGVPLRVFAVAGAVAAAGVVGLRDVQPEPDGPHLLDVRRLVRRHRRVLPDAARAVGPGHRRLVGDRPRRRAGRSGPTCPRRTTTSSSRSSARSSAWSARCSSSASSRCSASR